ncbi:MAG: hypothetical protein QG559_23 [Campylobacterota bacterium]|nr:hypothetical protein [Campylobacterota bacterium]
MLLYIHIPFCDSKCYYCSFNSYVDKFHLKKAYMHSLYEQLQFELQRFAVKEKEIESLFIGGGTPSCVEAALYKEIFELLTPYLKENIEITTEANPNSATPQWLEQMYELGVNRVSFGVQSFNDAKLKLLNRAHNSHQAKEAIQNAYKVGFKNISLDLIYAVATDTKEILENDLKTAFSLPINHLSAYALTIEEGTPFEKKPHLSHEKLSLTKWLFKQIESFGCKQYEISNFGKYRSFHNMGYWQYKDYIGAGSGAVGKMGSNRYYPTTNLEAYIANPLDIHTEMLSKEDQKIEKIFLGLRSCVGVKDSILNENELKKANILIDEKKLIIKNDTFYNTDYLLADEIALFIS